MPHEARPPLFVDADARVVETWPSGRTRRIDYYRGGRLVGRRLPDDGDETSFIEVELDPDGRRHGLEFRVDEGELVSIEPYERGLPHGVAEQWATGELIGMYTMDRGTGLDLWRSVCCQPCWAARPKSAGDFCRCNERGSGRKIYLAEARFLVDGLLHGFEYWIDIDQRSVYEERHFFRGKPHGIERVWNASGALRRGYPRYWVDGERVDKRRYVRASQHDPTLPPFRREDNRPERTFPPEVAMHLAPAAE